MATWQLGPFDNDDAVEWCAALEAAPHGQRAELVRRTLDTAVLAGRALTAGEAARAVAAAATALQLLTGTPVSESAYAPRFLLGRGGSRVNPSLRGLAIQALNVILADESAWRLQWANHVEEEEALAVIEELRLNLASTAMP
ncbi:DUF4259 domain-containing protein [Micromonospora narathiwatensis]|uniref:DUF4259 domain-containing protein n=1 Tax=Micromonospora narathiwatensis TaxID=299146 RepID=A0A1A9AFI4_9ACTN|nr:DUF4259 domain-containing protein [Micromonospora narathiwatensis]SBT54902.1 protein of unknown function (DUF4259) [Micromonospora narathiwatensis]